MPIPKYILHPTLLFLGGGLIFWLASTHVPTAEEIVRATPAQQSVQKNLPARETLRLISDFTEQGEVVLESPALILKINDSHFQDLTPEAHAKLRDFFKGKLVSLKSQTDDKMLNLPIELYDPLCFKPKSSANLACPLILEK